MAGDTSRPLLTRQCIDATRPSGRSIPAAVHARVSRRLLPAALMVLLAGCASLDRTGRDHGTALGCTTGALLGAALGASLGNSRTALQGAALGMATGCAAGYLWQSHQQALDRVAQEEQLQIDMESLSSAGGRTSASGQTLKAPPGAPVPAGFAAQIRDQGMFPVGSDQPTPDGRRQIEKIGTAFAAQEGTGAATPSSLLVVGHTDATGTPDANQRLSEARAKVVGQALARSGVDPAHIYFQGAGASRPLGDNDSVEGRAANRRIEIVELASIDLLKERVANERGNPRYLAYGTSGQWPQRAPAMALPAAGAGPEPLARRGDASTAPRVAPAQRAATASIETSRQPLHVAQVDFGGVPADGAAGLPAGAVVFKSSGGTLIGSAHAAALPMRGCDHDRPRVDGIPRQMASGAPLEPHPTRAYLSNMNGRPWAGLVNGHQITLSPVAVLADGAEVVQAPRVLVVENYRLGNRETTARLSAQARAYEGETSLLYRVFVLDASAPVSCLDVVLPKDGGTVAAGKLYYPHATGTTYAADFRPSGF